MTEKDVARFWAKVDKRGPDECWEWLPSYLHREYGRWWHNGKSYRAHRISYEIANGRIRSGLLICHHCDNPPCVNPSHLFEGTHKDNAQDATRKGRFTRPDFVIEKSEVRKIRRLYKTNTLEKIGVIYGVNATTIRRFMERHDIPRRRGGIPLSIPNTEIEKIQELCTVMPSYEIGKMYGVCHMAVLNFISNHGINNPNSR